MLEKRNSNLEKSEVKIAIIGSGPSGIAAGRELLQQGFTNFTIYEKEKAAGGTWHSHTYPGLACDVWAHSYCYTYAPNPNFSSSFVDQPEIEAYLQKCSRDFGLESHTKFNTKILAADLQKNYQWELVFENGLKESYDIVINAMGNQHTPVFPTIDGVNPDGSDAFKGPSWHSTDWNHEVDIKDKRVLVVGSAAAAVQIVPEIAKVAKHLTVLQRSANWIMPRNKKVYSLATQKRFKRFPFLLKALRYAQGVMMNFVYHAVSNDSRTMSLFENICKKFISENFSDESMRESVTPDSRYGCKRPLVSDDFYPALNRDNVSLVHDGAKAITETGCITLKGEEIGVDIIIYCTGYKMMDFDRIAVAGLDGKNLADEMEKAPEAYKGILTPDFPNYFMVTGPNAVALTVSYYKSVEQNVANIVRLVSEMIQNDVKAINARHDLTREYNDWIIEACKKFSWGSGGCQSYYVNKSGRSPFIYPSTYKDFIKMRLDCDLKYFDEIKS